ncbi:MAG: nucleoside-diphosphate kinase [Fibrobacterota bacterium]
MIERTFAIIKPNAVRSALAGEILRRYETARFRLLAMKLVHPTKQKVAGFYAEHEGRPFFDGLCDFMSSGPIVVLALEGEDAIAGVRALNGATDPAKAAPGTIRHAFGPTMGSNVVHSSDSTESAAREISYWFSSDELVSYTMKSSLADV